MASQAKPAWRRSRKLKTWPAPGITRSSTGRRRSERRCARRRDSLTEAELSRSPCTRITGILACNSASLRAPLARRKPAWTKRKTSRRPSGAPAGAVRFHSKQSLRAVAQSPPRGARGTPRSRHPHQDLTMHLSERNTYRATYVASIARVELPGNPLVSSHRVPLDQPCKGLLARIVATHRADAAQRSPRARSPLSSNFFAALSS